MAMSSYFETGGGAKPEPKLPAAEAAAAAPSVPSGPRTLSGAAVDMSEPWPSSKSSRGTSRGAPSRRAGGGIMTFNDLRSHDEPRERDDDPVNLFTGGERSGLNVENPEHNRRGGEPSIVDDILSRAAASSQGASALSSHASSSSMDLQGGTKSSAFSGRGFSTGGAVVGDDHADDDAMRPPGAFGTDDEATDDEEPVVRHLTFWQDGFTIEDGLLMRYDDPANQSTLQAINSGRAPLSLLNVRFGQPVELLVARRTHEKYVPPPPPPLKPFEGAGNRLGAPSADGGARSTFSSSSTNATASSSPNASAAQAVHVDPSQPIAQIQVRLNDGQRIIVKLNTSHTVADMRRYIEAYVGCLVHCD